MLLEVETWQRYGICALKEECGKRRIPVDGLYERRDVLERLETVLVWQHMSLKQLQSECWRRRIPYIPQKRVSHILLLETENPHADEHGDLLRRLMQDAYPGTTGPLPLGGVAGVWTPGAGSFTAGGVRLPAWTGASAPGFEETGTPPPPASQGELRCQQKKMMSTDHPYLKHEISSWWGPVCQTNLADLQGRPVAQPARRAPVPTEEAVFSSPTDPAVPFQKFMWRIILEQHISECWDCSLLATSMRYEKHIASWP
eukprot:symbB.v1.2.001910.t1/scaffold102.1/size330044/7